jgi:hypothetical protein
MLASVGFGSVRTASATRVTRSSLSRRRGVRSSTAGSMKPAHRAGQRRAGPRAAVGPARSFPGEGAGNRLPGIRRPHRPHLGQDVVGDAQHVGIAPGLAGAVNRADHRLGAEPETRIAADPPALPGGLQTRLRAFADQGALELGDGAEDLQGEPPLRAGGVDRVAERAEPRSPGVERLDDLEQVGERAGQPVDPDHDQNVAP